MISLRESFVSVWSFVLAGAVAQEAAAAPVEITIEDDEEEPAPPPSAPPTSTTPAPEPATPTDPPEERDYAGVTQVEPSTATPEVETVQPRTAATATDPAVLRELAKLRAEVKALSEEVKAQRRRPFVRAGIENDGDPPPTRAGFPRFVAPSDYGVRLSGYLQLQYQWSQLSEDQLQQGGVVMNRNRFMVRRGRLRVSGDWRWFAFELEIDGSTTRGPFIGIRQANVSTMWRNPKAGRPPFIMLTAGLTEVPFGYEVRLGQREMIFMERSTGSLAFFPGPVDVGVRLRGGVGPLRYDFAVMNGTPLDDRAGGPQGLDPTKRPDVAGRLGFETLPKNLAFGGGVSFLWGTGFHPGTDATKNKVEWHDLNESGTFDTGELVTVPGTAALPSENFSRWAANVDLQFGVRTKIGWTRLLAEGTIASNLDRGFLVADPVTTGADVRHVQAYAGLLQDATKWAVVGARYDFYNAHADYLDQRRGSFTPADASVHTISPLVGAVLPQGIVRGFRGRLVFQYDVVLDHLGRDTRGVPANLKNDGFTVRLQGEF